MENAASIFLSIPLIFSIHTPVAGGVILSVKECKPAFVRAFVACQRLAARRTLP